MSLKRVHCGGAAWRSAARQTFLSQATEPLSWATTPLCDQPTLSGAWERGGAEGRVDLAGLRAAELGRRGRPLHHEAAHIYRLATGIRLEGAARALSIKEGRPVVPLLWDAPVKRNRQNGQHQ